MKTNNTDKIITNDNTNNTNPAVNCDNTADSTNLFNDEQSDTIQPRQQRIGKQQRKSDFAEFKATYLTPAKLVKRHPVNIEEEV